MASSTKIISEPLPQEMQQHTYSIMYQLEGAHWWFVGRRRIIERFLEPLCQKLKADHELAAQSEVAIKILDIGCGTGANLEMLSRFGDAEGVDVSAEALAFCRERGLAKVRLGEAEHLPWADGSFDLVTGLDVVEHLDDDVAGLKEMRRVLRPGGYAFLFVPAFMFLWGVQDDVSHHRRRYTRKGLQQAARAAGFAIERVSYANLIFFPLVFGGRLFMRLTRIRPKSENNINIKALNGLFGRIFGAEGSILRHVNLPFGVSAVCVLRRVE